MIPMKVYAVFYSLPNSGTSYDADGNAIAAGMRGHIMVTCSSLDKAKTAVRNMFSGQTVAIMKVRIVLHEA